MTFATSGNCDQAWELNTWCHGYLSIPWGTQPGTYQLVWWKYERNPSGEEYSTCFEIVVNEGAMNLRDLPVQALSHVEAALPSTPSSASPLSIWSSPVERDDKGDSIPRFEMMASMASEQMETTDNAFAEVAKGEDILPITTTLIELNIQPDDTLSGTQDHAVNQDGKKNREPNSIYADDDRTLAGDAINNQEGKDTSPLSIEKPSQLINDTLSGQVQKPSPAMNASVP
ncbi:hypothetical protein BGX34_001897 [Mortierella sp. NVP85]|nr:hypothetical protein BGX34_001897 [Mortierella sp. NVP85]